MAGDEEVFFCSCKFVSCNGDGGRIHAVKSNRFEYFQSKTVKLVMCSAKENMDENEKQRKVAQSAVTQVQIYWDNTAITMSCGAFEMYPVHIVLLNVISKLRQKLIYNGHIIVRFLLVEFEEGDEEWNTFMR